MLAEETGGFHGHRKERGIVAGHYLKNAADDKKLAPETPRFG